MLLSILSVFASLTLADPTSHFSGPIEMNIGGIHKESIVGKMDLLYEGDAFQSVLVTPDKPVVGKKEFPSTQAALENLALEKSTQLATAFKLKGPTHKWLMILVGSSTDGSVTFESKIYKFTGTFEEATAAIKGDLSTIPTAWKEIGKATLKRQ